MKVKELLEKMETVDSYGVYDKEGIPLVVHASIHSIIEYLEEEVRSFHVFIYDDVDHDINDNKIDVKRVRCCIYCDRYVHF